MKIFYYENDLQYADLVRHHLEWYKLNVIICYPLETINHFLQTNYPDLLLINGNCITNREKDILYQFKTYHPYTPIIFIFSISEKYEIITQYKVIFNDYLFKEHFMEEAYLRLQITNTLQKTIFQQQYFFKLDDECSFNYIEKTFKTRNTCIKLTPLESEILWELCKNLNVLTYRQTLLKKCWSGEDYLNNTARYLDKYMVNIRKYIQTTSGLYLATIRNKGYCLLQKHKD